MNKLIVLKNAIKKKNYSEWTKNIKTMNIQSYLQNYKYDLDTLFYYIIEEAYSKKDIQSLSDAHLRMFLDLIEIYVKVNNHLLEVIIDYIDREYINLHDSNFEILIEQLIVKFDLYQKVSFTNQTFFTVFRSCKNFEWFFNLCKKLSLLDDKIYILIFQCFIETEYLQNFRDKDFNFNFFLKYLDDDLYLKCISSLSKKSFLQRFKANWDTTKYNFHKYLEFILSVPPEIFLPIFFTPLPNGKTILNDINNYQPNNHYYKKVRDRTNIRVKKCLLTTNLWILETSQFSFYWQWLPFELVQDVLFCIKEKKLKSLYYN
jgi:hypothetical protein